MWKPHERYDCDALHSLSLLPSYFPVYGSRIESSCYEFFIAICKAFGIGEAHKYIFKSDTIGGWKGFAKRE